jgi:glutathione synthase
MTPDLPPNQAGNPRRTIAFVMDAYETLNLDTETSLLLMGELMQRGHTVCWLEANDLTLRENRLQLKVRKVKTIEPFVLSPPIMMNAVRAETELDALIIRKDPPFERDYLHLTYLLDFLPAKILQINPSASLRAYNEKLFALQFPEYCAPTIVSSNKDEIRSFAKQHRSTVIKPLDDCSGRRIFLINANCDKAIEAQLETAFTHFGENAFVMAQIFLPGVSKGDKRVFLVDGVPVGAVNRIPRSSTSLANIHQGAVCESTEITENERRICAVVGEELSRRKIVLAGLDFIDGYLTEVNITSPSAVRQINEVDGLSLEKPIVDSILSKVSRHRY